MRKSVLLCCFLVVALLGQAADAFVSYGSYSDGRSCSSAHGSTTDVDSCLKEEWRMNPKGLGRKEGILELMPLTSTNPRPLRQQIFASPLISTMYERVLPTIWEAGLRIGGPDAEYESAARYLLPAGVLLDLSCGTGFVAQRMAQSGEVSHVFALDYSSEMLQELTKQSYDEEILTVIRGDAMELPFVDEALDAIHWGAAMHCVPDALQCLRECHRVLKPGGKLYATTFLRPFPDVIFKFFTTSEIRQLATEAGFSGRQVQVEGIGVYGILKATK